MIKYGYFMVKMSDSRKGFVTVAITRPDKEDPDQNHVASFAFCSPKDVFRKIRGRKIAEDRLNMSKNVVHIAHKGTVSQVIDKALMAVVKNGGAPSWVRKAVKNQTIQYGLKL